MRAKLPLRTFLFVFCGLALVSGCRRERATRVTIEDGQIPTFLLAGGGELASFSIYLVPSVPEKMDRPFSEQVPIWQIVSQSGFLRGRPIEEIRALKFGTVPDGYRQSIPEKSIVPRSIESDKVYYFNCETLDAPSESGFFRLVSGKVVRVQVKTPCWGMQGGKWLAVPCAM